MRLHHTHTSMFSQQNTKCMCHPFLLKTCSGPECVSIKTMKYDMCRTQPSHVDIQSQAHRRTSLAQTLKTTERTGYVRRRCVENDVGGAFDVILTPVCDAQQKQKKTTPRTHHMSQTQRGHADPNSRTKSRHDMFA